MKLKTIAISVAVLAALAGVAYFANKPPKPAGVDPRVDQPIVAASVFDQAIGLRISDQGKTVELKKTDGNWLVSSYYDLPADFDKLSRFANDLTEAKVTRFVSANPETLTRLEFKDTAITVTDAAGKTLWSVTLGKNAQSGGRYVKFGDEKKGYLASLNAWLDTESKNWANPKLTELKADDIAKVSIGFTGDTPPVVVSRDKKEDPWKVDSGAPSPEHKLRVEKISSLISTMSNLRFSDTTALDDANAKAAHEHSRTVTLTTFDGKTTTVELGRKPEEKIVKAPAEADKSKTGPLALGEPTDASKDADKKPALAADAGLKTETIPAGPVFAFVKSSDASAPVNALEAKRATEIYDYAFTSQPQAVTDLFDSPAPPPVQVTVPAVRAKAPTSVTTPPVSSTTAPEPAGAVTRNADGSTTTHTASGAEITREPNGRISVTTPPLSIEDVKPAPKSPITPTTTVPPTVQTPAPVTPAQPAPAPKS